MANDYYTHGTVPQTSSNIRSYPLRNEFDLITLGFTKFPALVLANANKALVVHSTGDAVGLTTGTLALAGNFATTGAFNTTFVQQATTTQTLPSFTSTLSTLGSLRGHIWGLTISNNTTDTTNDLDIAPGACLTIDALDTNLAFMRLTTSLTKRLDASWAVGTNQGGRATGVALTTATYHVFLVQTNTGLIDAGFDTSRIGTNLLATIGISKVRRIASITRFGGISLFKQIGNLFTFTVATGSGLTNPGVGDLGFAGSLSCPDRASSGGIIDYVYLYKVTLRDSTPAGETYARWKYTSTNTVPTATNCQLLVNTAKKRKTQPIIAIPGYTSGSSAASPALRLSFSDADVFVMPLAYGWIDFRDP